MNSDFNKVLVFFAHPDDGEFMAGGSMATWAAEGKEVVLCVVTNGSKGSNDPNIARDDLIQTRQAEQHEAAKMTGVSNVIFLGYEDCYIEDSHELRRDMIREIRRVKPDVVVGPDPTMYFYAQRYINHPDHRKVGEALCAALSPGSTTLPLYRDELYDKGFEPHQVKIALLGMCPEADFFVDITDHIETKIQSVLIHHSQTPEFSAGMGDRLREWAAAAGAASGKGYKLAEALRIFYLDEPPGSPEDQAAAQSAAQDLAPPSGSAKDLAADLEPR